MHDNNSHEALERRMSRLEAIESIKLVKARYFRCVDLRLWDEFAELFTDDLEVDFAESTSRPEGKADFLASVANHFGTGYSVHHGHLPEIEIVDDNTATAIWPMYDRVESPPDSGYVVAAGIDGVIVETNFCSEIRSPADWLTALAGLAPLVEAARASGRSAAMPEGIGTR